MVDANEKEPRSIRLQGLSECQREGDRERDGQGERKRLRLKRQEDGGLNNVKTQIFCLKLVSHWKNLLSVRPVCYCRSFGSTELRGWTFPPLSTEDVYHIYQHIMIIQVLMS